jgi:hypothetical protein
MNWTALATRGAAPALAGSTSECATVVECGKGAQGRCGTVALRLDGPGRTRRQCRPGLRQLVSRCDGVGAFVAGASGSGHGDVGFARSCNGIRVVARDGPLQQGQEPVDEVWVPVKHECGPAAGKPWPTCWR